MLLRSSKYTKIGPYGLGAALLITVGVTLRVILIGNNWPLINSDEAITTGLQALHILTRGERPIFAYGLDYLGPLQSYLGAFFFLLFGPSTFALRLGLIVLYAGFLLVLYLLASLLYTKGVALATLFFLCWGSSYTLDEQLWAYGGRFEILLFGTLSLLLASWLALSFHPDINLREQPPELARRKRLVAYTCLGGVIGLGLWSDLLVLPFVCTSVLLLLLFCHSELRTRACFFGVLGLLVSSFPRFLFYIQYPQDNLLTTLWQHYTAGGNPLNFRLAMLGTVLVTLPAATGANPLCPVSAAPDQWVHQLSLSCMAFQGCWSLGIIIVWALAVFVVIKELREHSQAFSTSRSPADKKHLVRCACRLMLLASAALTVLPYAVSANAAIVPLDTKRYLMGLQVTTPAIIAFLWPRRSFGKATLIPLVIISTIANLSLRPYAVGLWVVVIAIVTVLWPRFWLSIGKAVLTYLETKWTIRKVVDCLKIGVLCFISATLILGMVTTFLQIPETQKAIQRQNMLINSLLRLHASHIYSDYWTCYRLIFLSDERIICSVLNTDLSPGWNRYPPYAQIVKQDGQFAKSRCSTAYIFDIEQHDASYFNIDHYDWAPIDGIPMNQAFRQRFGAYYHPFYVAGFVIYLPASNIPSAKSRDLFAKR